MRRRTTQLDLVELDCRKDGVAFWLGWAGRGGEGPQGVGGGGDRGGRGWGRGGESYLDHMKFRNKNDC